MRIESVLKALVLLTAVVSCIDFFAETGEARSRPSAAVSDASDWPMYNHDPRGTRWNRAEHRLGRGSVPELRRQWRFQTDGAVAGTPAVVDGITFAVDSTGTAYALTENGREIWRSTVEVSTDIGPKVTASPLVSEGLVIFGDQAGFVHGLDAETGRERWSVRPNPHPGAVIFSSATPVEFETNGRGRHAIAVGVSSVEELYAIFADYRCCTFRGSVALIDPEDGDVIWQRYLVDEPEANSDESSGPSGAPVWSTPTFDRQSETIYVTTGNNYSLPATDTSDAIVALRAETGRVRWVNQRTENDIANATTPPEDPEHPDYDFGDSPQIYRVGGRKVVGAGQKSGLYHALGADRGGLINEIRVAPGGGLGGLFADSAVAESTIYANGTDWPFVYAGGEPRSGSLSAISGDGSRILWHVETEKPNLSGVAVANDVVYFQSLDGFLYALDTSSGALLARERTGGQFGGPAISRGRIYLGTGDMLSSFFNPFHSPGPGSVVALGVD